MFERIKAVLLSRRQKEKFLYFCKGGREKENKSQEEKEEGQKPESQCDKRGLSVERGAEILLF